MSPMFVVHLTRFDFANANLNHEHFEKLKVDKVPDVVSVRSFNSSLIVNCLRRLSHVTISFTTYS